VFIALHGRFGEDGTVQGILDGSASRTPAAACSPRRSRWTSCAPSAIWQSEKLPHRPVRAARTRHRFDCAPREKLGLPLMVKPASEGSSIGMSKVRKAAADLEEAICACGELRPRRHRGEIHRTASSSRSASSASEALPIIKLETPRDFYDYQAKYISATTRAIISPAGLAPKKEAEIQALC
jgi:D-alanine-D-alanine ligase